MTKHSIRILAGTEAFRHIRTHGLQSSDIEVITGAAGGPKWLALSHIDRFLFSEWFKGRSEPLHLVGSSAGAWRLAAASTADPLSAFTRFEDLYIDQQYRLRPTAEEVSVKSLDIVRGFLGERGASEILAHPSHRLNILVNRCRGPLATEHAPSLKAALGAFGMGSLIFRPALTTLIDRCIGHDPRESAPLPDRLKKVHFHLSPENLAETLLASGSIPVVMQGVRDIRGTVGGMYRDGGLLDYHVDLPFRLGPGKLILSPHFIPRIIPGWFDRFAPWRKARFSSRTILIVPSDDFVRTLPMRKVPCRKDFYTFAGRDAERKIVWKRAVSSCKRLADDLAEILTKDAAGQVVEAL